MRTGHRLHRQRGAVLLIALIVLVAMSLAGVALVRGVDMTNLIAGNLAFKQGATLGGDWGAEQARAWLAAQPVTSLQNDIPGRYFASMQSGVDFTATDPLQPDFNWAANSFNLGSDPAGNPEVRYIVHRMCDVAGPSEAPTASAPRPAARARARRAARPTARSPCRALRRFTTASPCGPLGRAIP
jgi:hypothetical protein